MEDLSFADYLLMIIPPMFFISGFLWTCLFPPSSWVYPPRPSEAYPGLYPGPYPEIYLEAYAGPYPALELASCVACTERYLEPFTFLAPCDHRYCADCLTILFENAIKDESMYPPRCCGEVISLNDVRSIISPILAAVYFKKILENENTDRTYCANPSCHSYILPDCIVGSFALCFKCAKITCHLCKDAAHLGTCPSDHTGNLLLRLAEKEQWQLCGKCNNIVIKRSGCDSIR
jgi:hypothetical protein